MGQLCERCAGRRRPPALSAAGQRTLHAAASTPRIRPGGASSAEHYHEIRVALAEKTPQVRYSKPDYSPAGGVPASTKIGAGTGQGPPLARRPCPLHCLAGGGPRQVPVNAVFLGRCGGGFTSGLVRCRRGWMPSRTYKSPSRSTAPLVPAVANPRWTLAPRGPINHYRHQSLPFRWKPPRCEAVILQTTRLNCSRPRQKSSVDCQRQFSAPSYLWINGLAAVLPAQKRPAVSLPTV